MAQGKLKVKNKLPPNAKAKNAKGRAVTKRRNAPVKSKAAKRDVGGQAKVALTKLVNEAAERDLRARASGSTGAATGGGSGAGTSAKGAGLSMAQQRVARANTKPAPVPHTTAN